jgi:hypothetical protein
MEALTVEQFKKCQRLLKAAMGREVRVRIGRRTLFRGFIVKGEFVGWGETTGGRVGRFSLTIRAPMGEHCYIVHQLPSGPVEGLPELKAEGYQNQI